MPNGRDSRATDRDKAAAQRDIDAAIRDGLATDVSDAAVAAREAARDDREAAADDRRRSAEDREAAKKRGTPLKRAASEMPTPRVVSDLAWSSATSWLADQPRVARTTTTPSNDYYVDLARKRRISPLLRHPIAASLACCATGRRVSGARAPGSAGSGQGGCASSTAALASSGRLHVPRFRAGAAASCGRRRLR